MAFTSYKQTDYPEIIHSAGCGPTSCAIVLSAVNSKATPEAIADWMAQRGWFTDGGSDWNGLAVALNAFGGGCPGKEPSWNMYGGRDSETYVKFQNHIKSGYTGVLLMGGPSYWSRSGHFIAIIGYDAVEDKYLVSDPVGGSGRDGWHSWADFDLLIKFCYRSTVKWTSGKADEYTFTAGCVIGGAVGINVAFWQRMLKGLGFYDGDIDGQAGSKTVMAIRNYQKAYSLTNDGALGEQTAASIMQGIPRDGMTFTLKQCKYQTHSASVRVEQILLKSFGYYKDADIDLDYGPATTRAVTTYQQSAGLVVDGVCGPGTFRSQINL